MDVKNQFPNFQSWFSWSVTKEGAGLGSRSQRETNECKWMQTCIVKRPSERGWANSTSKLEAARQSLANSTSFLLPPHNQPWIHYDLYSDKEKPQTDESYTDEFGCNIAELLKFNCFKNVLHCSIPEDKSFWTGWQRCIFDGHDEYFFLLFQKIEKAATSLAVFQEKCSYEFF